MENWTNQADKNQKNQDYLVQKILTQYTNRHPTELDELCALDRKVKKPVNAFGYGFGIAAALIMGCGMSLVMTDIGKTVGLTEPMLPGIVIGVAGMALALANSLICKRMLAARRKRYAEQIIALSDRLTG